MPHPSDGPSWFRPVLAAAEVAERALRTARILWWAGWAIAATGLLGSWFVDFQPETGDEVFTTDLQFTREAFGGFLARAGFTVVVAVLLLAVSVWVRAAASQLVVDAARARHAADDRRGR